MLLRSLIPLVAPLWLLAIAVSPEGEKADPAPEVLESAPLEGVPMERECPILKTLPSDSGVSSVQVEGEGECLQGEGGWRLTAVREGASRYLGDPAGMQVHPGDRVFFETDQASGGALTPPAAPSETGLIPLEADIDRKFSSLKGRPGQGAAKLRTLKRATQGILEAVGTFDLQDNRAADGAASVKVLLKAAAPGVVRLRFVQTYERDLRRGQAIETGLDEWRLEITVVPETAPLDLRTGNLLTQEHLKVSVGDFLAIPVSMGYMNRGGSESRGSPGVVVESSATGVFH